MIRPLSLTDDDFNSDDLAAVHCRMRELLAALDTIQTAQADATGKWTPSSDGRAAQLDEAQRVLDQLYAALRGVRIAVSNADAAARSAFLERTGTAVSGVPEYLVQ
ncbi:hypothetical protein [Streptomyces sp. NEAU-S7GS2]|uniref:hypothetical protein n=1 Tax=Streptomyces sp. NEAU-S7GS2 TaxID=2202000 RepID=UPI000D6EDF65|nr:hypothetical protein [Streptomyces sp. NEAU-S7GS2]AWN32623.1 hypothetical protein DKG71_42355 [Streptomyces sp. NEAU-S7GS2]